MIDRQDIIEELHERTAIPRCRIRDFLELYEEILIEAIEDGEDICLYKLFTITNKVRAPRTYITPMHPEGTTKGKRHYLLLQPHKRVKKILERRDIEDEK